MKSILKITSLIAVFTLVLATFAQQAEPMQAQAVHVAEHETLGTYLVDAAGRTLYVVVNEGEAVPCTGECAEAWPPFTLEGMESMMGEGMTSEDDSEMMGAQLDSMLLGTVAREDGSTQVTYNGYPLYYFVGDVEPGEVNCQAVEQFGGTWYVLSPQGEVITTALTAGG
jgi:predicted lipoprotein with Yx(FWY)xxD motif